MAARSLALTAALLISLFIGGGTCDPEPADSCGSDECGPAPMLPTVQCWDGTTAGPGECVRDANGVCGWEITSCPEQPACSTRECGPRPLLPSTQCADGTYSGPGDCSRDASGTCGWEIRRCIDYPRCGGFAGFMCPDGLICVDNQADDCDPAIGADCIGICVDPATCVPPTCPDRI